MPTGIKPMLAVLGELPRDPSHYGFEYKWDGVRALGFVTRGRMMLQSRNLLDITRRYPELAPLGSSLGSGGTILDGEIVALDESGKPSFPRLQRRMHVEGDDNIRKLAAEFPVSYVLFDVLWARGRSTMSLPYTRRREILEDFTLSGPAWHITPAHVGQGEDMLEAARINGMEGLVAKRLDSVYEPGRRSPSWIKIKVIFGQEFVIGGWIPEKGINENRVGSLLLGYYDCPGRGKAPRFHYAGGVGTGFNAETHAMLTRELKKRKIAASPFADAVPKRDVLFVKPELVAEIEFRRWPDGGLVQQASFKGLRFDKKAKDVVNERHGCAPS
jgi:bifunctional non-homologous end joining protein LigD